MLWSSEIWNSWKGKHRSEQVDNVSNHHYLIMQRMVFAKEFAKNLHDGRISDEPSRLESAENKALQNLCYIVSQGDSLSWFIVLSVFFMSCFYETLTKNSKCIIVFWLHCTPRSLRLFLKRIIWICRQQH